MSNKERVLLIGSNDKDVDRFIAMILESWGYGVISHIGGEVNKSWGENDEVDESWFNEIEQIFIDCKPFVLIKYIDTPWDFGLDFCGLVRSSRLANKIGIIVSSPIDERSPSPTFLHERQCWPDEYLRMPFAAEELRTKLENLIHKYKAQLG